MKIDLTLKQSNILYYIKEYSLEVFTVFLCISTFDFSNYCYLSVYVILDQRPYQHFQGYMIDGLFSGREEDIKKFV